MWELFEAYKKETKNNPIKKHVFVGKDGNSDYEERERPLTMEGFELYVMNLEGVKSKGVDQYFANQDGLYDDYMGICSRIRKIIREDQIGGGMAGIYNASITQRLNNLKEQVEQNSTHNVKILSVDPIADAENDN